MTFLLLAFLDDLLVSGYTQVCEKSCSGTTGQRDGCFVKRRTVPRNVYY
jgi:hypothetical protein